MRPPMHLGLDFWSCSDASVVWHRLRETVSRGPKGPGVYIYIYVCMYVCIYIYAKSLLQLFTKWPFVSCTGYVTWDPTSPLRTSMDKLAQLVPLWLEGGRGGQFGAAGLMWHSGNSLGARFNRGERGGQRMRHSRTPGRGGPLRCRRSLLHAAWLWQLPKAATPKFCNCHIAAATLQPENPSLYHWPVPNRRLLDFLMSSVQQIRDDASFSMDRLVDALILLRLRTLQTTTALKLQITHNSCSTTATDSGKAETLGPRA